MERAQSPRLVGGWSSLAQMVPCAPSRTQIPLPPAIAAPAIAFSASAPWVTTRHLPTDTTLWLSPSLLAEAVYLTEAIVTAIHNRPLDWARPESGGAGA